MPAGRPPKPIEQHLKEGTFKKSRHGDQSTALVVTGERGLVGKVEPPSHLTRAQREIWFEIATMLDSIVRESDAAVVEGAAVAFARYREAKEILDRDGLMVVVATKEDVVLKAHPMVAVEKAMLKLFLDFSGRLGLSPADRARLGLNMGALAKTAGDLLSERYDERDEDGDDTIIEGTATEVDETSDPEVE